MNATERSFVQLPGGMVLPFEPVRLALDLEARGLSLTIDGVDLVVGPRDLITAADRVALKRWKRHIIALLSQELEAIQ